MLCQLKIKSSLLISSDLDHLGDRRSSCFMASGIELMVLVIAILLKEI